MNTNCLEGFKCPNCDKETVFHIQGTAFFDVTDMGAEFGESDYDNSVEWGDDSPCVCHDCRYAGVVRDFKASPENGFQFFEDVQAVLNFICEELAQTLEDDAERLDDDDDKADARRRLVADIRKIEPLVKNAARLREHLTHTAAALRAYGADPIVDIALYDETLAASDV